MEWLKGISVMVEIEYRMQEFMAVTQKGRL